MPIPGARTLATLAVVAASIAIAGCGSDSRKLRFYVPVHQQFDPESIQGIFAEQSGVIAMEASGAAGSSALHALTQDKTDLTLLENSTSFVSGVRAVLPIYESVLHVLVRDDFTPLHQDEPLRGASFHVIDHSVAGKAFVEVVTHRQGLGPGEYSITSEIAPGETDFVIYFGPIDPKKTDWYVAGYQMVSPVQRFAPERGSHEERVSYIVPNMKARVIPAFTYDLPGNREALVTVAVDTLLVARRDIPAEVIYELTRTLLEQKPRFTAVAPQLFAGVNESFDPLDLNFPLHEGARRYLERNEPGFLERYAESINMLVYVTFLLMSGFLALARWRAQRKKDRIDVFYERVLAVRDQIGSVSAATLLSELSSLEREAFSSLIEERLAANESFRIFTDLLFRVRDEVRSEPES